MTKDPESELENIFFHSSDKPDIQNNLNQKKHFEKKYHRIRNVQGNGIT